MHITELERLSLPIQPIQPAHTYNEKTFLPIPNAPHAGYKAVSKHIRKIHESGQRPKMPAQNLLLETGPRTGFHRYTSLPTDIVCTPEEGLFAQSAPFKPKLSSLNHGRNSSLAHVSHILRRSVKMR